MRFKSVGKVVRNAAFVVLALGMPAALARAQSVVRGHFTLPYAARWGSVTLAPGKYTFTLRSGEPADVVYVQGDAKRAPQVIVLAEGWNAITTSSESELVLERHAGVAFVRALRVGEIGAEYEYPLPKSQGAVLAAGNRIFHRNRGL